ncbi:MAG: hypothetical protein LBG81_03250 [Coriobacteriaceae bacterium]|jgi:hypothetical protein|nr:hypothetical protein [Coriobacteriaceae bacterium]
MDRLNFITQRWGVRTFTTDQGKEWVTGFLTFPPRLYSGLGIPYTTFLVLTDYCVTGAGVANPLKTALMTKCLVDGATCG